MGFNIAAMDERHALFVRLLYYGKSKMGQFKDYFDDIVD